jgi:hypothetical protein
VTITDIFQQFDKAKSEANTNLAFGCRKVPIAQGYIDGRYFRFSYKNETLWREQDGKEWGVPFIPAEIETAFNDAGLKIDGNTAITLVTYALNAWNQGYDVARCRFS